MKFLKLFLLKIPFAPYFIINLKYMSFKLSKKNSLETITITSLKLPSNLNDIFESYGSDKGTSNKLTKTKLWNPHSYGGIYEFIFHPIRDSVKNVFECGIGTNDITIPSNMGPNGKPGASLRAWRDFFLHANIYGADIDQKILFSEPRIYTGHLDQTSPSSIAKYFEDLETEFEVMIDDGLHTYNAGICLFTNSIKYLSRNGYYVIEDISNSDLIKYHKFFSNQKDYSYICLELFKSGSKKGDNNLVVIQKIH